MLDNKVSLFKNTFSHELRNFTVQQLITWISTGFWKEKIESLRKLPKAEYNKEKVNLPAITWSGTFKERKITGIKEYSSIMSIDVDNLQPDTINNLKAKLSEDQYVFFAFISPSGSGLKILVNVNTTAEQHKIAFAHLQAYFQEKYELQVDNSCKDLSRLCFVSYDEFAIIKESIVFEVDLKYGEVRPAVKKYANSAPIFDSAKIFDVCVKWVERTYKYEQGNRHIYCFSLACALNRCGVSFDEALNFINGSFDLPEADLVHSTKSAYFRNQSEHGSVTVTSYGVIDDYKAPVYEIKYDDDLIWNEIKRYTGLLYSADIKKEEMLAIISMIAKYYNSTKLIDITRKDLGALINEVIDLVKQNAVVQSGRKILNYMLAEDLLADLIGNVDDENTIPTGFEDIDIALRGGMTPGNVYGIIGTDMTFKSILAQYLSVNAACRHDRCVLYLNGEMTTMQWYERLSLITVNAKIYDYLKSKQLDKNNFKDFIKRLNQETNGNLFYNSQGGWTVDSIKDTISAIEEQTGKKIWMVVIDGLTQMDWGKENEIQATTTNSMKCKELAKEANDGKGIVVVPLLHISGENDKLYRATGLRVRGGGKTLANMDGYFSTSLFEDPASDENSSDIKYVKGKFYLRFTDKRGNGGIINNIINVPDNLRLEVHPGDPATWESNRSLNNNHR